MKKAPFAALALVAAAAVGFEVALTRYFALAHYSEYGYWVISLAMAGFAVSGVVLSLWRERLLARRDAWLSRLPLIALYAALLGYYGCCLNPFNALELQHPALWPVQLLNIGLFYAALFPFFFCCGLYVGLCFSGFEGQVPRLYAFDLAGAGLGALGLLLAMWVVPPFFLPAAILPFLALAAWLGGHRKSSLASLLALELALAFYHPARLSEYKPLSYALHTQGSKVLKGWDSPRGSYAVVDAFTERLDLDLSNNASMMGVSETPESLGLYVDGSRLSNLPKAGSAGGPWFKAALESLPYEFKPSRVLLIGSRGGFKLAALRGQVADLSALESDPELFRQIKEPGILRRQPLEFFAAKPAPFDLIDIASDYAVQDRFALTREMLAAAEAALSPQGVLSVGVSVQELGAYGARLVATLQGLVDPQRVLLVRSAWSVRALVFKMAPTPAQLKAVAAFCDRRSFDLSYAPGLPEPKLVWNELQSLGWGGESKDALRDEASLAFAGKPMLAAEDFDLRPASLDRPFFFSTLKLSRLGIAWEHLSEWPREELGLPVNLAVLAQALLLALLVLLLPALARGLRVSGLGALSIYFSCLGLGYLFYEVTLIEKITPYLQDRAWAFSLVLSVMLVASGAGSYFARSLRFAFGGIAAWTVLAYFFLDKALFFIWPWPLAAQALACVGIIAPLAFALGMPFSLGLKALSGLRSAALPWAWSLNGAFSVIAPPLAFLGGRAWGYSAVAGAAFLVYFLAWISFQRMGTD